MLAEAYRFCERTRNRSFLVVGSRRLAPDPTGAGDTAGPVARLHGGRAAGGVPAASPAGPAHRGAALLRPRVKVRCPLREDDGASAEGRGRRGPVPLHPQVKTLLDTMAGPAGRRWTPTRRRRPGRSTASWRLLGATPRRSARRGPARPGPGRRRPGAGVHAGRGRGGRSAGRARVVPRRRLGDRRPRHRRRHVPGAAPTGAGPSSCRSTTAWRPSTRTRPRSTTAWAALAWAVENAARARRRPGQVRGRGRLAPAATSPRVVAQRARDEGGPELAFQLLVYPVTDLTTVPPVDGRERRGLLPDRGRDGLVRRPLPRRDAATRRTRASRRCTPTDFAGLAAGARHHRRVRPAPRRGRGVRRSACARPACRSRPCATTGRSTASSRLDGAPRRRPHRRRHTAGALRAALA